MNQHRRPSNSESIPDSAVNTHINASKHSFNTNEVIILDRESKWFERGAKEAIWERVERPTLNKRGVNHVQTDVHLLSGSKEVVPCIDAMEVELDIQSVKWYRLTEDGLKELLIEADYISNHSMRFQLGFKLVKKTFLEIENVGPEHNGTYTCIVQRGNSAQQTEITFNFIVEGKASSLGNDVHLLSGASERVQFLHHWSEDYLHVQWYKLTDEGEVMDETLAKCGSDGSFENHELCLKFPNVTIDQAGSYKSVITRNDSSRKTELVFRFVVDTGNLGPNVHILRGATELIRYQDSWNGDIQSLRCCRIDTSSYEQPGAEPNCTSANSRITDFDVVTIKDLVIKNVTCYHKGQYLCVIEKNGTTLFQRTKLKLQFIVDVKHVLADVYLERYSQAVVPCINVTKIQLDIQSVKWYRLIEDDLKELLLEADYTSNRSMRYQRGFKLVNKTFLEIENVSPELNGTYSCIVQRGNSAQQTEFTFNFIVVEKESWHHILLKVLLPPGSGFILLGGLGFLFVRLFKKWLKEWHDRQHLGQQSRLSEMPLLQK
ncbi:uncharacterized protein [Diadema antillarum]|uniref:uncharacterized protein n=1 Tax=Diadema antillarum TaxID=105358 RepID=UPI003A88D754